MFVAFPRRHQKLRQPNNIMISPSSPPLPSLHRILNPQSFLIANFLLIFVRGRQPRPTNETDKRHNHGDGDFGKASSSPPPPPLPSPLPLFYRPSTPPPSHADKDSNSNSTDFRLLPSRPPRIHRLPPSRPPPTPRSLTSDLRLPTIPPHLHWPLGLHSSNRLRQCQSKLFTANWRPL
ncbi:hypothetical protein BJ508DRAFT_328117 [Ascobolus immersus RN42]|uniref:Uncharacterized protein n=1 Tax=Ascobolus immersus RN42 TaxID=1160509 RepID=A0A3N4ID71_ASCIM|nr:hypothetical protein BJ508DRAFT_328117 [Ascobolus immersus RN42]